MSLFVNLVLAVSTLATSKMPRTSSSGSELMILPGMAAGGVSKIEPALVVIELTFSQ